MNPPRLLAVGESALSVEFVGPSGRRLEFGELIAPELNARVRALDLRLAADPIPGLIESIPSYRSLLVSFDPRVVSRGLLCERLLELAAREAGADATPAPTRQVPTVYDGEDLEDVARTCGLGPEDVVRLHSGTEYTVQMLGFSPGFAYLGQLPEAIAVPRRATPRTRVPAGSVAIAGRQTGIYPRPTPGGWSLIGRSAVTLFDPALDPPTFLAPGDRVRFVPASTLAEERQVSAAAPSLADAVLEVLDAGVLTTVQDLGRPGFQRLGVPVAGALDGAALRAANALAGNAPGAAALECTLVGPRLRLMRTALLALAGADLRAVLERSDLGRWEVPSGTSFLARAGSVLSFEGRRSGGRAYLAVAGGLDVPLVLGSRATDLKSALGGYCGRALRPGDILATLERPARRAVLAWPREQAQETGAAEVRVLLGPQDDFFTPEAIQTFLSSEYALSTSSDRAGCRLEGPLVAHRGRGEIVSDGNVLGSIQVPPDGHPIVLLADRGSTGGYPRIATVIAADADRLGQRLPGDRLRFRAVGLEAAIQALAERRAEESQAYRALEGR
jgi:KipI family sensor histidine kinase inhibitor